MGSKSGPSFAYIYVNFNEREFLRIQTPIYKKRFIDDVFLTTDKEFNFDF